MNSTLRRTSAAILTGFAGILPGVTLAAAPARSILVCGDSLVKVVARSLTREFAAQPSVTLTQLVSIGTGLARPDVFDWPAQLRQNTATPPDAVVIMLGANDAQNLQTQARTLAVAGTPEWRAEYSARVAAVLSQLAATGVKHILWIGMPDMRDRNLQEHSGVVNAIVQAECAKIPAAEYMDSTALFSPKPGTYSAYVIQSGKPVLMRASDGCHLNADGADLLARTIHDKLAAILALQ